METAQLLIGATQLTMGVTMGVTMGDADTFHL